jgi:hypothetical protein
MANPRNPDGAENSPVSPENNLPEDGFNRRIGLALVISIGANVLLLQGAGVMAKNMSLTKQQDNGNINVAIIHPTPTPAPEATPVPTPAPTPTPKEKRHEPKPTPKPKRPVKPPTPEPVPTPPPTPKPEVVPTPPPVKPTPVPIHYRVRPTPPPEVTPDKTPTPVVKTPTVVENRVTPTAADITAKPTEIKTATTAPAIATTPINHALRANNRAALGRSTGPKALVMASRSSSAANSTFLIPATTAAPVPRVHDLPNRSVLGSMAAAFTAATTAHTVSANTPDVQTTMNTRTTSQLATVSGRMMAKTQRVALMTRTTAAPEAAPSFSVTAGGTAAPGSHLAIQGSSATSNTAAISVSSPTQLATNGSYQAIVNVPGMRPGAGPVGVFRPGKILSRNVEMLPSDRTHGTPGGGVIAFGSGSSGAHGGSSLGAATRGGGGTFGIDGGTNASIRGGSGIAIAGSGSGREVGLGNTGEHRGSARGNAAGSVGGTREGNGLSGPIGVPNGVAGGGGNGGSGSFKVGARTGGTPTGIGSSGTGTFHSSGSTVSVRGSGGSQGVSGPKAVESPQEAIDRQVGPTHSAVYKRPLSSQVATPASLRGVAYNVKAVVRVVFMANGQSRASIAQSSGYPALDEAVIAACSHIKFEKAMQDGSPVDDPHEFEFELQNKG